MGTPKGKYGRGAFSKILIVERQFIVDNIVYTNSFRSYNVLDVSDFKDDSINHGRFFFK